MNPMPDRKLIYFSLPLAGLVAFVSIAGLVIPGFYSQETLNWQAQSTGQDIADLFLATPALLFSMWFAFKGRIAALPVWGGTVLYLLYTFVIYCFGVHFNMLFPVYCLILGLSFYSMIYFFVNWKRLAVELPESGKRLRQVTALYFIIVSVLFYLLWLAEILPSVFNHSIPASLAEAGLPTNPVHAIDLSVFLPGLCITGILLLKKIPIARILAVMLLTFTVLMDITIAGLIVLLRLRGLEANPGISVVMLGFALFSLLLVYLHLRHINTQPVGNPDEGHPRHQQR